MARLVALAALALIACGDDDATLRDAAVDAAPTGTARVTVLGYDYAIDLETRAAATRVTLQLRDPGDCVVLPSRAPMLDPGSVTLGGAPARATVDGATLTACGAGWAAGAELDLTARMLQPLQTWGSTQVGYSVRNDGAGQPLFYLLSWVGNCDRFGPCDPTPSAFAHYRFTVHHRLGVRALCPGRVTAGDTTTVCEFDRAGGPTYSTFGIVASPSWQVTELGTWSGVRATLYDRPASGIAPLLHPEYHQAFLAWMVARFGPYPFGDELRVVTGPTYWAGFEHPGNIVLADNLGRPGVSSYARPVGHVLNHEIVHQWAGDQTTLADTYDFVWKEAMAEYLSFAYEDETEPAVARVTASAWKRFAAGAAYFPVPTDRPALVDYYGEVYGPGPMLLFRQLEILASRDQVIAAIQSLLGAPRAVSVAELQAALERTTGLELDRYFATWIVGAGAPIWPTFRVEVTGAAPAQEVVVTETTAGALHGCDFGVELHGADGEVHTVMIRRGVDGVAVARAPTGVAWPVTSTVLDPDAQCLAYPDVATARRPRHPPGWSPWTAPRDGARE